MMAAILIGGAKIYLAYGCLRDGGPVTDLAVRSKNEV
jgi:hypothetical protein